MIDNCTVSCSHVIITFEEDSASGRKETKDWCSGKDITFAVTHTDEAGRIHILVKKREEIKDQTKSLILGLVLGIAFFGLLLIVLYRIIVEMYDRKEYNRFLKARSTEQWNKAQNPLYQSATTTVMNPNFTQD